MFKVDCYVEDKNLASVLRSLSGVAREVRAVPAVNAEPTKAGGVKAPTNGNLVAMFAAKLKKIKAKEVTPDTARAFLKMIGASPASYGYLIKKAVEHGVLSRKGTGREVAYAFTGKVTL